MGLLLSLRPLKYAVYADPRIWLLGDITPLNLTANKTYFVLLLMPARKCIQKQWVNEIWLIACLRKLYVGLQVKKIVTLNWYGPKTVNSNGLRKCDNTCSVQHKQKWSPLMLADWPCFGASFYLTNRLKMHDKNNTRKNRMMLRKHVKEKMTCFQ